MLRGIPGSLWILRDRRLRWLIRLLLTALLVANYSRALTSLYLVASKAALLYFLSSLFL